MSQNTSLNPQDNCACLAGNFDLKNVQHTWLSGDTLDGEVELLICKLCERRWLSISYQPKVYEDDDRWFRGLIDAEAISAIWHGNILENARAYLVSRDWYYTSGTYWINAGVQVPFKRAGEIILWP